MKGRKEEKEREEDQDKERERGRRSEREEGIKGANDIKNINKL